MHHARREVSLSSVACGSTRPFRWHTVSRARWPEGLLWTRRRREKSKGGVSTSAIQIEETECSLIRPHSVTLSPGRLEWVGRLEWGLR